MESTQSNAETLMATGKKKPSLTPRGLINYHIENPEEPITDEDIQNLNLDYGAADNVEEDNIDSEE